jgi:hypothetical protein
MSGRAGQTSIMADTEIMESENMDGNEAMNTIGRHISIELPNNFNMKKAISKKQVFDYDEQTTQEHEKDKDDDEVKPEDPYLQNCRQNEIDDVDAAL